MIIQNVTIADPSYPEMFEGHICIQDGKIIKIIRKENEKEAQKFLEEYQDDQIIDGTGLMASPGLVDVHVHFRDPGFTYKEDIITGAAAAAKGGFTTVVLMANTKPVVDNADTLQYVLEKGKETGIHVKSCCAVTKGLAGKELADMKALSKAGAAGFTDDGVPILDEQLLRTAMQRAAECNKPISLHEENPAFIQNNGVNAGTAAAHYGIGGSDRKAEINLVERDIQIALETGADLNVQHISTKEAVELVREGRKKGNNIHAEATPHHFTLTQDAVIEYGTMAKMNPPLRTEEDRLAIIEGLKDNTIELIATDHAPHAKEEKEKPITEAPSGIVGLETAFALGYTKLVLEGHLTVLELLEKMSLNPAKLYGLPSGGLKEGEPADLFLWNKDKKWKVESFASKSWNSPFIGWELQGAVEYTICDGNVIYMEEKMTKRKEQAKVLNQKKLSEGIYDMWIETSLAKQAKCGQFISVYPKNESTLLPRPISICEVNNEKTALRIVYRIAGKGTHEFSEYQAGDSISILGTLGNGFPIEEATGKNVFLIGGGIGIPPMLQTAKEIEGNKTVLVGYRDENLFLADELAQYGEVVVATEDGSKGVKGNVMDAIREKELSADIIFACGPMPMLRAIKEYAKKHQIKAYISLEERMACGVGACLGCVAKTKEIDSHSHVHNARICTDGPVFEAGEVEI